MAFPISGKVLPTASHDASHDSWEIASHVDLHSVWGRAIDQMGEQRQFMAALITQLGKKVTGGNITDIVARRRTGTFAHLEASPRGVLVAFCLLTLEALGHPMDMAKQLRLAADQIERQPRLALWGVLRGPPARMSLETGEPRRQPRLPDEKR